MAIDGVKPCFNRCYGEYQGNRKNIKAYIRYVVAKLEQERETTAYRVYMSENIRTLSGVKISFWDWTHPTTTQKQETRTGDEIAFDIIKRAGLKPKMQGGEG